jgi:predicted transcriptional regulator
MKAERSYGPLEELGIMDEGEARVLFDEKKMKLLYKLNPAPIHTSKLKNMVDMSLSLALYHLKQLVELGYAGKIDTGYRTVYFITDKGKKLLQKDKNIIRR